MTRLWVSDCYRHGTAVQDNRSETVWHQNADVTSRNVQCIHVYSTQLRLRRASVLICKPIEKQCSRILKTSIGQV